MSVGLCGYCFLGCEERDVTLEKNERDGKEHREREEEERERE